VDCRATGCRCEHYLPANPAEYPVLRGIDGYFLDETLRAMLAALIADVREVME